MRRKQQRDGEEATNKIASKQESVLSWKPSEESVSTGRECSTG